VTLTSDLRATLVLAHVADPNGDDRHTARTKPVMRAGNGDCHDGTNVGLSTATLTSSYADPLHMFGTGAANVSWSSIDLADVSSAADFAVRFQLRHRSRTHSKAHSTRRVS